jgi:hypothetical protein
MPAPAAPTGFAVSDEVGGVRCTWTGPTLADTPDLAGFKLYTADDSGGTNATLVQTLPVCSEAFHLLYPPGTTRYFNLKAYDASGLLSGYALGSWAAGKSKLGPGTNLAANSDFERDLDADSWPDTYTKQTYMGSPAAATWPDEGIGGGKCIKQVLADEQGILL